MKEFQSHLFLPVGIHINIGSQWLTTIAFRAASFFNKRPDHNERISKWIPKPFVFSGRNSLLHRKSMTGNHIAIRTASFSNQQPDHNERIPNEFQSHLFFLVGIHFNLESQWPASIAIRAASFSNKQPNHNERIPNDFKSHLVFLIRIHFIIGSQWPATIANRAEFLIVSDQKRNKHFHWLASGVLWNFCNFVSIIWRIKQQYLLEICILIYSTMPFGSYSKH